MNTIYRQLLSPVRKDALLLEERQIPQLETSAIRYNTWQLVYTLLQEQVKAQGGNEAAAAYLHKKKPSFFNLVSQSVKQQAIQEHVIKTLHQNGIPAIVLKGTALAQQIYNNTNARNSCDIDLLIQEQDISKTHDLLSSNNISRADPTPLPFVHLRLHHATYYSEGFSRKIPIELHWNFSIPGFFKLSSEDIWAQTQKDGQGNVTLKPEMTMVLLLMHHHRHAFKEFRNLVDLFWAFYRFDEVIKWDSFADQLKKIGLIKTSYLTLQQIEQLWPQDASTLQGLQRFKAGIHKTTISKTLLNKLSSHISSFDDQHFTLKDKIIYRLALDHGHVMAISFFKSIVPPPQVIQSLYPENRKAALPLSYLRYLYWRFFTPSSTQ